MRVVYVSPQRQAQPSLFAELQQAFAGMGIHTTTDANTADVAFVYQPGGFVSYNHDPIDKILTRRLPVIYFDTHDYWGHSGYRSAWPGFDNWRLLPERMLGGYSWASWLGKFVELNLIKTYFMWRMQRSQTYPDFVKPLESCAWPTMDCPLVSKEELFARPNDVCFIGMASTCRANCVCDFLADGRLKVDWHWPDPHMRMSHNAWLERHCNSKLFVEADGAGFGSDRPFQLYAVAPMLKIKNDHRVAYPWTHDVNCVEVGDDFGFGRLARPEIDKVVEVVNNADKLYEIYVNGAQHVRNHFSVASRISQVVEAMRSAGLPV